jgi:hypothetical protein
VSLRRLTYRPDGMVHYQGTRFHPRLGIDHQLLSALEFLALLIPHVLLRYEVTIRSYGAVSTSFRKKVGWIAEPPVKAPPPEWSPQAESPQEPQPQPESAAPLAQDLEVEEVESPTTIAAQREDDRDDDFQRSRRRGWAKLIAKVYLEDPQLCATCRKPMRITAALSSPEQDDVIERILRHLELWDPPWKRQRAQRARAPPAPSPVEEARSRAEPEIIDPPFDDEHEVVRPALGR